MNQRYIIDDVDLDAGTALALHRLVLAWAAARGDRFRLSLRPEDFDQPDAIDRLLATGESTSRTRVNASGIPTIDVEGVPGPSFINQITMMEAPEQAISGDLCPAEDVVISRGGRRLFALYDYGRTQILELEEQELAELQDAVRKAGIEGDVVVIAPPYAAGAP